MLNTELLFQNKYREYNYKHSGNVIEFTHHLSAPAPSRIRNLQGSSYSSIHQFSHLLLAFKLETAALASTDKDIMMMTDGVPETYTGNLTDFRDLHKLNEEVVLSLVEPMS